MSSSHIENFDDVLSHRNYYSGGMFVNVPLSSGTIQCEVDKFPLFSRKLNISVRRSAAYFIVDSSSDVIYVGSSARVMGRLSNHRVMLRANRHENRKLREHFRLSQIPHYDACIFYAPSEAVAKEIEQYLLDRFLPCAGCCNIATDSTNAGVGWARSLEHLESLRAANVGKSMSDHVRQRLWEGRLALPTTSESRAKMRESRLKVMRESPDGVDNVLQAARAAQWKPVSAMGVIYPSGSSAARTLGVSRSTFDRWLNDPGKKDYFYTS